MGLQAQLPEVADEGPADTHGEEEGDQQGDQAEGAGDDHLGDGVRRDRVDAVLVAVGGVVVEVAQFVQDTAGGGVPALGGDTAGHAGPGGDGRLLGGPQGGAGRVLPEALVPAAVGGGQQRQVDVVHHRPLGHEIGDVPRLGAGEPAGDQGGAEEGVLAGEQFARAGDVDQGAVLLVQAHVVDDVEVGEQFVAGVHQPVVQGEGLRPVHGAVLDAAAQRADAVEGVQHGGEPLLFGLAHRIADVGVRGTPADLGDGLVGGGAAALQGGQGVGGARVGEVDEGLAAFLLEDADGVLDRVADLLHDGGDVEQAARLTSREHRGEGPDRGQGHQRHEKQRHDLPADRLPAKAHGLPQLVPHRQGVHMCVNKRREPTTDAQTTRRPVRNPNLRTTSRRWSVVRSLREIAHRDRTVGEVGHPAAGTGGLAGFFRPVGMSGNLERPSFVLHYGKWRRNRPQEPHPASGRRKAAQAGQPEGSRVFGHGRAGCRRWGVTW